MGVLSAWMQQQCCKRGEHLSALRQLSGQDATFLYLDTDRASTGGTMIYVYDQTNVSGGKLRFKQILEHVESRIGVSAIFRQKLKQVPLALDYPYWVTDKNFDIENHVFHVALPKPGDWRQFCILASRLTRPNFDMSRPLWEMYVVEGLDNVDWLPKGSFAILTRVHHAAVDGTAVAEITWALHDVAADIEKSVSRKSPPRSVEPTWLEMGARAWWHNMTSPVRLARPVSHVLPIVGDKILDKARSWLIDPVEQAEPAKEVPETRFNQRVSAQRVYCSFRAPLDKIKAIRKKVPGSTVNDVVVAMLGGALRHYLDAHEELPEESMVAAMPVNTRPASHESSGAENQITFMAAAIGTHIADPIERLHYVREQTAHSKTVLAGIGAAELTDINKHAPSALLAAAGRMVSHIGFDTAGTGKRLFNVGISNVPGPTQPLYLKGAELRYWSVVGPLADGMGAIFAVTSYNGEIFIAPTACRAIVPDPELLQSCIEKSFRELVRARLGKA